MKTTEEPTTAYIDAAIERMEAGLTRRIRSRARRTLAVSLASAAVVVVAVATVGIVSTPSAPTSPPQALDNEPLTAGDIAAWTSTPTPVTEVTPVISKCEAVIAREPLAFGTPTIVNSDVRGRVQSVIIALGGYSGYCIGTSVATAAFVLLNAPPIPGSAGYTQPTPAPDAIALGPSGGNTSANGWTFAEGAAGSDVVRVTLHEKGVEVEATVAHGTWIAWWPSHGAETTVSGTITITGANGTTSTVTPGEVQLN
jgi:hypothetical protein